MDKRPKVSVVMPAYNHGRTVTESIRSVVAQTEQDWELIIINDGSTDDTAFVIGEYLRTNPDSRISLISQTNLGAHSAINYGVSRAQAPYISILNSDDLYAPTRLEHMMARASRSIGADFFGFSLATLIDDTGATLAPGHEWSGFYSRCVSALKDAPSLGFAFLLCNPAISTSNFFFSRALFDRIGGFKPDLLCHDLRFALNAVRFVEPELLYSLLFSYRRTEGCASHRFAHRLLPEFTSILAEYFALTSRGEFSNPLAPARTNWPNYFDHFLKTHTPIGLHRTLAELTTDAEQSSQQVGKAS